MAAAVTRSHCGHSRVSSVFCALFFSNVVRLRGLCLSLDMHRGLHGCPSHLGRYVACLPRQIQSVFRSYGCLMLLGVQCMKQRTCTYIRNNGCDMVLLDVQIWASHTSSSIVARKMKFRLACFRTCTWADTTQVQIGKQFCPSSISLIEGAGLPTTSQKALFCV